MIKVEVIEGFTLAKFNELQNIQRKSATEEGRLFKGDIFECTPEMAEYLQGNNKLNRAFVKVIEVIPVEDITIVKKEEKPVAIEKKSQKKTEIVKKETKTKKTIAKK